MFSADHRYFVLVHGWYPRLSKALRFEEACKSGVINRDDESEVAKFSVALSSALKASAKCVFEE